MSQAGFCCYYPFLWREVWFQINRFTGTKCAWKKVLFRENVLGGTKCQHPQDIIMVRKRDSSPALLGFLLHPIRLVVIQGEALGLADPLLLFQLDIFLGLLE